MRMRTEERVFVIAGTCEQAETWARENGIDRRDLYHVVSATSLQGIRPGVLHIVGTATRDRSNVWQTIDWASAVGWELAWNRTPPLAKAKADAN